MTPHEIVAKLIALQDKESLHRTEYLRLQHLPGKKTAATDHHRKAVRLQSQIQGLIRMIARAGNDSGGLDGPEAIPQAPLPAVPGFHNEL